VGGWAGGVEWVMGCRVAAHTFAYVVDAASEGARSLLSHLMALHVKSKSKTTHHSPDNTQVNHYT
jgi:hypothetical protein